MRSCFLRMGRPGLQCLGGQTSASGVILSLSPLKEFKKTDDGHKKRVYKVLRMVPEVNKCSEYDLEEEV